MNDIRPFFLFGIMTELASVNACACKADIKNKQIDLMAY